ncbi:MAG: hypothetical protein HY525_00775 [Betaproteobacteria bacterium]|nr:hypothetical protein [Betaproteobacteria bacterium]
MGARTKKPSAPYIGRWHIVEMEQWDQEFIDLEGPGHITFAKGGKGSFHFGAVEGELDCRLKDSAEGQRVEFSWTGHDEMDPVTGRGWAVVKNGELHGHLYFHLGDDSWFRAVPFSRSNHTVETDAPQAAHRSR